MKFDLNTAKNAVITTAVTLAVIYAMRKVSVTAPLVQKALAG